MQSDFSSDNSVPPAGATVAISVEHLGFHPLNAARIVYVVDDDGPIWRYGFAYGTLMEHAEHGEERFSVDWNDRKVASVRDPRVFAAAEGAC